MPVRMESTRFRIFDLPFLALQEVSKHWNCYDLFALATQSKKSRNIIRNLCANRKFNMRLSFHESNDSHRLIISEEDSNQPTLSIICFPMKPEHIKIIAKVIKSKSKLTFEGCSKPVLTVVKFGREDPVDDEQITDMIETHWRDDETPEPYQILVPHLAKIFQTLSAAVSFIGDSPKSKEYVFNTIQFMKNQHLDVRDFNDFVSSYSFDEVKQLMKKFKYIALNTPNVSSREQKSLFKMWMEEENVCDRLFLLVTKSVEPRQLSRILETEPVINWIPDGFVTTRPSDGRDAMIESEDRYITFCVE